MVAKWPEHLGENFNLPEDGRYVNETCREIFNLPEYGR